jgi:sugar-specific transcriptional regulator TrmB
MLFEPGKMFIKTERSSARRAYDVCHVLEQVGVVERIKIKKKKGYLWLGLTNVAEYMNRNYLKRLPRRENNLPLPSLFSTSFSRSSSTSSSTSSSSSLSKSTKRRRKLDNIVLPLPENITSLPILCDLTRTYIEIMIKRREIGVYLSSRNIIQRICNTTASSGNILKKTQVQRRIYDVLGVLEIVGVVKKKYKPKEYCLNTLAFQTSMSADFTKTTLLKCQELKSPKHEEKEEEGAEEDAGYKIKGEDKVGCEFPIPRTASLNMMMSAKNQSSLSSCKTPKKRSRDITDHFHKTEKEKNDRKKIRKKTKQ